MYTEGGVIVMYALYEVQGNGDSVIARRIKIDKDRDGVSWTKAAVYLWGNRDSGISQCGRASG